MRKKNTLFLQDLFLNALKKDQQQVFIFLTNGIKLHGKIEAFDQYVIILKNSIGQMVYKHAISTIVPSTSIKLPIDECNNEYV